MTAPAETAVLVGVGRKSEPAQALASLAELRGLAETAGAKVAAEFSQRLERFQPATLIGRGKVEEISRAAAALAAKTVIFDWELSPAQQKNLEKACQAKIIDRTRLILDIFAQRARTSEGRLQVELAQLSYALPRLTGSWRAFSQQVGGIGTRGPGERKLEYERRHIQSRILHLKKELEKVKSGRDLRRRRRLSVPVPQVALIGYTNVGKSTLLNTLTRGSAGVYADDKLFATLDPTSRRVRLPEGGWAVVTDTVGFIQRLPTTLIAAFRSTLEEAQLADCLVILSDPLAENMQRQDRSVDEILKELGAEDVPRLRAFNKSDRLDHARRAELSRRYPDRLFLSAATGEGVPEALERVQNILSSRWPIHEIELPATQPQRAAELYRCGQVLSETGHEGMIKYRVRMTRENWQRLNSGADARAPGAEP